MKIVFIHSLNNFTGSPNVLSVVVRGFVAKGYSAEIITSRGEGFLSDIEGVKYRYTCYRWSENKLVTLLLLMFSQIGLFFKILFAPKKDIIYYINSIVPFGAALACRLTGKRYIYHVHENMRQEKATYAIFRNVYKRCNRKSIFVSDYLKGTAVNCRDGVVVYNALAPEFMEGLKGVDVKDSAHKRTILMVASLRRFKGVYEFAELAKRLPAYRFELVLNAAEREVASFTDETGNIPNLTVYPTQTDLHPFYGRARLLMQLSHPDSCVETFGLTILEAMVYGVPAIVPNAGGPMELVGDGVNGFVVNPLDLDTVTARIEELLGDEAMYSKFSEAALSKSRSFSESKMIEAIEKYIFEK